MAIIKDRDLLNEDGSINIPVALRPYMGNNEVIK